MTSNEGIELDLDFNPEDFPEELENKKLTELSKEDWKKIRDAPLKDFSHFASVVLKISSLTGRTASDVVKFMGKKDGFGEDGSSTNYCPHCGEKLGKH